MPQQTNIHFKYMLIIKIYTKPLTFLTIRLIRLVNYRDLSILQHYINRIIIYCSKISPRRLQAYYKQTKNRIVYYFFFLTRVIETNRYRQVLKLQLNSIYILIVIYYSSGLSVYCRRSGETVLKSIVEN